MRRWERAKVKEIISSAALDCRDRFRPGRLLG